MIIKHYPSSRKFSKEEEKAVCDIVSWKPNNKHVRDFVVRKYGKLLTLKDIQNIKTKVCEQTRKGLQDAELLLEKLKESLEIDQGANGGVTVDEEDTLAIIFYQSSSMVNMFKKFPEIVFVDGTYNVNKLGMPLYCLMVEDGFGHGYNAFIKSKCKTFEWKQLLKRNHFVKMKIKSI